jgi:alkylation response protein AidB-like acyl-CoA dehydrogenase
MDLSYSDDEKAFRDEVRAFMQEKVTPELRDKVRGKGELTKADMEAWHEALHARGWLAASWPAEFGGAEWNAVQKHIFEEESANAS